MSHNKSIFLTSKELRVSFFCECVFNAVCITLGCTLTVSGVKCVCDCDCETELANGQASPAKPTYLCRGAKLYYPVAQCHLS